jgi:rod shape-determining protein MreC
MISPALAFSDVVGLPMARQYTQVNVAPSKVLTAMLIFSAVCMLIPRKWDKSDQIKQAAQPLTPLQALMTRGANWAAEPEAASPSDPKTALNQQALEGQVLSLAEEVRNLRQRNSELATLREGGYIPRRLGQLIQADVISHDSLAWRSVLEINLGGKAGAIKSQWATSALYLDRGSQDGVKTQRNVFTVECLVGQIVWVGPYTSRIQLLTDPASQVPVRIARLQPSTPVGVTYADGTFVLEGTGQGMVIQQVDYRLIESSGQVQVGDLVVLQPNANLPEEAASLRRVGRITEIKRDRSQSVCTLQVTPLLKLDSLMHVYVFDPTPVP